MRKLYTLALLSSLSSLSLFATGASGCDSASSSGCGAWWNNYTLGTSTDGIFAQSTGVALAYTATFTTAAGSQDPLSATFQWMTSTPLSTNNATSFGSLVTSSFPSIVSTNNASTTSISVPLTNFGDLLTSFTPSYTNNLASFLPTNTGGSTTSGLFTDGSSSSYSSYLAQIYALAYATPAAPTTVTVNNPVVGFADPIVPEPSSYVSMGLGLALVVGYARQRRKAKKA